MQQKNYFTARQLFDSQMLLTKKQTPIKSFAQVHVIVNRLAKFAIPGSWGPMKVLSEEQVAEFNDQQKLFGEVERGEVAHNLSTVSAPAELP